MTGPAAEEPAVAPDEGPPSGAPARASSPPSSPQPTAATAAPASTATTVAERTRVCAVVMAAACAPTAERPLSARGDHLGRAAAGTVRRMAGYHVWVRGARGCHAHRDTVAAIAAAG